MGANPAGDKIFVVILKWLIYMQSGNSVSVFFAFVCRNMKNKGMCYTMYAGGLANHCLRFFILAVGVQSSADSIPLADAAMHISNAASPLH